MRNDALKEQKRQERRALRQKQRDKCRVNKSGSVLAGLVLLGVGASFLMREAGVDMPKWLFTWPMILVVFGLFVGAASSFRDAGWLFICGIGAVFLLKSVWPNMPVWNYAWPVLVIIIGLVMIISPRRKDWFRPQSIPGEQGDQKAPYNYNYGFDYKEAADRAMHSGDNWLDVVSVFGNIKKQVYTKDFKGGDIVSVFGGSEINLMQADFTGKIYIEMVQVFGGAKLIVPPHWQIQSQMAAIFGGIEDKRTPQVNYDADKIVILNGTTLFGGIEIRSY